MGRIDGIRFWCVRNPTRHSELGDIMFETDLRELPLIVLGTGGAKWHLEEATFYNTRDEALRDATGRMARFDEEVPDPLVGG
ncbi:hypothetical protein LCGC14_1609590 [marine sediment metagenome]|uniref:Uncharacterized protein n=1 Tax=marine sediment metagenome TaxID=412755 RepID=A0A0F9IVD8_9ZZZZ